MNNFAIFKYLGRFLAPGLVSQTYKLHPASKKLAFDLYPRNFGRAVVLTEFITIFQERFGNISYVKVAVVGGYENEPEVLALKQLGISVDLTILGIDRDMLQLDLNEVSLNNLDVEFDLILCSQVWEHVWNHQNAFLNLLSLMQSGTYLWIACPTSNRAHGSPEYFSAGFTSDYFENNLKALGLSIVSAGQVGTARNYRATHTLPSWLSVKEHRFPILNSFADFKLYQRGFLFFRYLFRNLELQIFSGKLTSETRLATESWVLAQKI
jgi:SAM-dependent methyltransferase